LSIFTPCSVARRRRTRGDEGEGVRDGACGPVEQRCRELLVAEDLDPLGDGEVCGHHRRAALVAAGQNVKEFFAEQYDEVDPRLSMNDPRIHVGLGDASRIDRLTVYWPGSEPQIIDALEAGKHCYLIEGEAPFSYVPGSFSLATKSARDR